MKTNEQNTVSEKEFNQLNWVKIIKEYYKTTINPNDKYGKGDLAVTLMMELENFAEWLSKKGYLK